MRVDIRALTYSDAISFQPEVASTKFLDHLAYCLREADASSVQTQQDSVAFKASPFRLSARPWKAVQLLPFEFGNLTIDFNTREIRYRLRFRQLVIASTIMAGLMLLLPLFFAIWLGFAAVASAFTLYSFFEAVALTVLWWVFFVGVALLWGIPTFARFVRRAIVTAPRYAPPTISPY